jgi:hypothetical protein
MLEISYPGSIRPAGGHEDYNVTRVLHIGALELQKPKVDPHLQSARERVKAASGDLERLGIADRNGKGIRKDLLKDMREGADRDFRGDVAKDLSALRVAVSFELPGYSVRR